MDNRKRNLLEQETQRRYLLLLFQTGLKEIWTDQYRLKVLVLYLLTVLLFSIIRPWDLAYSGPDIFDAVSRIAVSYTHLDVYKRQRDCRAFIGFPHFQPAGSQ